MTNRYVVGNLAEDPEARQAGRVQIVTLTVLENTATYRGNERVEGHRPLRHIVEAKFELGDNVLASLRSGVPVIVIGQERDASFDGKEGTVTRRVIDATHIGPDLTRTTAVVTRVPRSHETKEDEPAAEPSAEATASGSLWSQG